MIGIQSDGRIPLHYAPSYPIPEFVFNQAKSVNLYHTERMGVGIGIPRAICMIGLFKFEALGDFVEVLANIPFSLARLCIKTILAIATLFLFAKTRNEAKEAAQELLMNISSVLACLGRFLLCMDCIDSNRAAKTPFHMVSDLLCDIDIHHLRRRLHFYQSNSTQTAIFNTMQFIHLHTKEWDSASHVVNNLAVGLAGRLFFIKDAIEGIIATVLTLGLLAIRLIAVAFTFGLNKKATDQLVNTFYGLTSRLLSTGLALLGIFAAEKVESFHQQLMDSYNEHEVSHLLPAVESKLHQLKEDAGRFLMDIKFHLTDGYKETVSLIVEDLVSEVDSIKSQLVALMISAHRFHGNQEVKWCTKAGYEGLLAKVLSSAKLLKDTSLDFALNASDIYETIIKGEGYCTLPNEHRMLIDKIARLPIAMQFDVDKYEKNERNKKIQEVKKAIKKELNTEAVSAADKLKIINSIQRCYDCGETNEQIVHMIQESLDRHFRRQTHNNSLMMSHIQKILEVETEENFTVSVKKILKTSMFDAISRDQEVSLPIPLLLSAVLIAARKLNTPETSQEEKTQARIILSTIDAKVFEFLSCEVKEKKPPVVLEGEGSHPKGKEKVPDQEDVDVDVVVLQMVDDKAGPDRLIAEEEVTENSPLEISFDHMVSRLEDYCNQETNLTTLFQALAPKSLVPQQDKISPEELSILGNSIKAISDQVSTLLGLIATDNTFLPSLDVKSPSELIAGKEELKKSLGSFSGDIQAIYDQFPDQELQAEISILKESIQKLKASDKEEASELLYDQLCSQVRQLQYRDSLKKIERLAIKVKKMPRLDQYQDKDKESWSLCENLTTNLKNLSKIHRDPILKELSIIKTLIDEGSDALPKIIDLNKQLSKIVLENEKVENRPLSDEIKALLGPLGNLLLALGDELFSKMIKKEFKDCKSFVADLEGNLKELGEGDRDYIIPQLMLIDGMRSRIEKHIEDYRRCKGFVKDIVDINRQIRTKLHEDREVLLRHRETLLRHRGALVRDRRALVSEFKELNRSLQKVVRPSFDALTKGLDKLNKSLVKMAKTLQHPEKLNPERAANYKQTIELMQKGLTKFIPLFKYALVVELIKYGEKKIFPPNLKQVFKEELAEEYKAENISPDKEEQLIQSKWISVLLGNRISPEAKISPEELNQVVQSRYLISSLFGKEMRLTKDELDNIAYFIQLRQLYFPDLVSGLNYTIVGVNDEIVTSAKEKLEEALK